jgi:hypothetical protein
MGQLRCQVHIPKVFTNPSVTLPPMLYSELKVMFSPINYVANKLKTT